MNMKRLIVAMVFLLICALSAQAQDLSGHPGYVDLDRIQIPVDASEITEVNLGPELLRMAAKMENGDSDLSDTLDGLFGIRVKSFGLTPELAGQIRPIVEDIQAQLDNDGWKRLVYVKDGNELVIVSMKYDPADENKVAGLMVIAFDPADEATFVNMVGSIDLANLGDLLDDVDIDLEDLEGLEGLAENE
jgi:hypothetical protein